VRVPTWLLLDRPPEFGTHTFRDADGMSCAAAGWELALYRRCFMQGRGFGAVPPVGASERHG
jgi:hypothetical protein